MKINCLLSVLLFLAFSCEKPAIEILTNKATTTFTNYKITQGQHYANNDSTLLLSTNYKQLTFICKFDNSAIYNTTLKEHQGNINKLYGFADNNRHHQKFSARFGWNWVNGSLHLWAYTYNDGNRTYKDLGAVAIGSEISCTIVLLPSAYIFGVNGIETLMPRTATTSTAIGYKLFPYFGGQEPAPQDITILIKEL
jgi:hypothetical protein